MLMLTTIHNHWQSLNDMKLYCWLQCQDMEKCETLEKQCIENKHVKHMIKETTHCCYNTQETVNMETQIDKHVKNPKNRQTVCNIPPSKWILKDLKGSKYIYIIHLCIKRHKDILY